MRKQFMAIMAAATIALPVTTIFAAEQSANVALTSNYVFRGQTLSNDNLAVQGGYDISAAKDKDWYAGVFLSTFDGGPGSEDGIETDFFAGWKGTFGKKDALGWDVGIVLYEYQGTNNTQGQTEIYAGFSYETALLKLFIGDDDNFSNGDYTYIDLGASFTVMTDVNLDLHVGHMARDFAKDYNDVSATLSKEVKGYDLGLSLTYEDAADEMEFFVTVAKKFDL